MEEIGSELDFGGDFSEDEDEEEEDERKIDICSIRRRNVCK